MLTETEQTHALWMYMQVIHHFGNILLSRNKSWVNIQKTNIIWRVTTCINAHLSNLQTTSCLFFLFSFVHFDITFYQRIFILKIKKATSTDIKNYKHLFTLLEITISSKLPKFYN